MKKELKISLVVIFLTFNACALYAQDSLIERILSVRESIVHIKAIQTNIYKNPQASAAINPKTGKIVVSQRARRAYSQKKGAGIILNNEGLIVTNLHTIRGAEKITVEFFNEKVLSAKVVKLMSKHDLALLKVEADFNLKPIKFYDSNNIKLKDKVIHISSSEILNNTISSGIIRGLGTSTIKNSKPAVELIKISINMYKGDSGGPILNEDGQLIGIIVAKQRKKQRVSFAIPSNKIKKLYLHFIKEL
ncbi:MAG: S1C family serine protease [Candidatus Zapsychrus exili]|nr:S1C family serine protease [Candidatus Zapsychrus exili]